MLSQNSKCFRKTQNEIAKPKMKLQNPKCFRKTQNEIAKLKMVSQNLKMISSLLLIRNACRYNFATYKKNGF
jgi:hypothetical protein